MFPLSYFYLLLPFYVDIFVNFEDVILILETKQFFSLQIPFLKAQFLVIRWILFWSNFWKVVFLYNVSMKKGFNWVEIPLVASWRKPLHENSGVLLTTPNGHSLKETSEIIFRGSCSVRLMSFQVWRKSSAYWKLMGYD